MDDSVRDLLWFIGIVVAIGVIWAIAGGKQRTIEKIINARATDGTGQTIGGGNSKEKPVDLDLTDDGYIPPKKDTTIVNYSHLDPATTPNKSPFLGKIKLNADRPGSTDVDSERVSISASSQNTIRIPITGWTIVSLETGRVATIGKAAPLPYSGQSNYEEVVNLRPGDYALITTGRSPLGAGFLINKCMGYFEQFQDYNPSLPTSCPLISEVQLPPKPNNLNDRCLNYIAAYPSCKTPGSSLPADLTHECKEFIIKEANYSQCVAHNKNDTDFYSKEWRLFLNRTEELWKGSRETLELRDATGKVVDRVSL